MCNWEGDLVYVYLQKEQSPSRGVIIWVLGLIVLSKFLKRGTIILKSVYGVLATLTMSFKIWGQPLFKKGEW